MKRRFLYILSLLVSLLCLRFSPVTEEGNFCGREEYVPAPAVLYDTDKEDREAVVSNEYVAATANTLKTASGNESNHGRVRTLTGFSSTLSHFRKCTFTRDIHSEFFCRHSVSGDIRNLICSLRI